MKKNSGNYAVNMTGSASVAPAYGGDIKPTQAPNTEPPVPWNDKYKLTPTFQLAQTSEYL